MRQGRIVLGATGALRGTVIRAAHSPPPPCHACAGAAWRAPARPDVHRCCSHFLQAARCRAAVVAERRNKHESANEPSSEDRALTCCGCKQSRSAQSRADTCRTCAAPGSQRSSVPPRTRMSESELMVPVVFPLCSSATSSSSASRGARMTKCPAARSCAGANVKCKRGVCTQLTAVASSSMSAAPGRNAARRSRFSVLWSPCARARAAHAKATSWCLRAHV